MNLNLKRNLKNLKRNLKTEPPVEDTEIETEKAPPLQTNRHR